jgi:hypothetical protein
MFRRFLNSWRIEHRRVARESPLAITVRNTEKLCFSLAFMEPFSSPKHIRPSLGRFGICIYSGWKGNKRPFKKPQQTQTTFKKP